jgi:proteasome lid subunit RPN8/RPN11
MLTAEAKAKLLWWAASEAPLEACGVIVGLDAYQLKNVHPEPENFFLMDDNELLAIYEKGVPCAVWHSHPNGDPSPSPADIDGCPPGMAMLIVANGEVHLYFCEEANEGAS